MVKIYFLLHVSKYYIERHPLKEIINWVSIKNEITERPLRLSEKKIASKIAHYTRMLSKYVLFKSKCYDKALTVKKILNDKNIPSVILMGVKNSDKKGIKAHALVKCQDKCIIGGEVAHEYTFVQSFF